MSNKTAAELLRGLNDMAMSAPWTVMDRGDYWFVEGPGGGYAFDDGTAAGEYSECCTEQTRDALVTTRNLLPLMAALVEAVGEWRIAGERHHLEPDFHERLARAENALVIALDALNAAAAKEVK